MRVCWWVFGPFLPGSGWCALSQAFTVAAARASPSGMQEWLQHHAASSEMIATALCGQKAANASVCHYARVSFARRRGQPVRLLRGLFASVSTAASSICICHSLQWSSYIRSLTALYAGSISRPLHADRARRQITGAARYTPARQPQRCRAPAVSCSPSRPPRPPSVTRASRPARSTRRRSRSISHRASPRSRWADSGTRKDLSTPYQVSRRPLWGIRVVSSSSRPIKE